MNIPFIIGIVGSLILVIGAAWPVRTVSHPALSRKNQIFACGNACMCIYSYLNFVAGGSVFFIFLQILIIISTILMMLNTPDTLDAILIGVPGIALVLWSLSLFEGYQTVIFVAGLVILGIGYALNASGSRRNFLLALGSILIAIFSYLVSDWIFFFLNIFFALFSSYHAWRLKNHSMGKDLFHG